MTTRPILFDATRLLTRIGREAPTGIDRVDIAYAEHVLARAGRNRAVAGTPFGVRLMPEAEARATVAMLAGRWRDGAGPAAGPAALARVFARLGQEGTAPPPPAGRCPDGRGSALPDRAARLLRSLRGAGWPEVARAAPRDAILLHTSHLRLDRPGHLAWLDARPDIRPVVFVHDLIPIAFPEYGVPGEADRHRRRLAAVGRRAAAVIANSEDVAEQVRRHLAAEGLPAVPVVAAPLGIEAAFTRPVRRRTGGRPYFVVCGTIEARKNHLLLLQVWRDLAAALGPETPALVVVGRRGWEAEAAADLLDRCAAIRPHVIEASGLPTAGLAELMAGARALLMPSFAEGYGLPVVEALSLGTPVIASDIPAHREVSAGAATLLHPLDGIGWRDAILAAAAGPPPATARPPFPPPTWQAHFAAADAVLDRL